MKHLVLLGDGMADFPLDELGGKTPIAAANTPAMDDAARLGITGLFMPIPDAFPPGSDIRNLSVFGYDPHETFTGRAPLEAVNQNISIGPDQLVFRCNLVTLENKRMKDFSADHISSEEAAELIQAINDSLGQDGLRFYPGVGYRHLLLLDVAPETKSLYAALQCTPPHDISDQEYEPHLPKGDHNESVIGLMEKAQEVLRDHSVNQKRILAGKLPATSIWLWGQGGAPSMQTYAQRFDVSGAVISAVDLVNGIGKSAGLEIVKVQGATGYVDTNYAGKVEAALNALETVDFVYLHVEAPDEAAHEGDTALKIKAIEDFDALVVKPCMDFAKQRGDCRIVIGPDHITSIESRTHAGGPVPFILYGSGITPNDRACYSEEEAAKAGVLFPDGHTLIPTMLTEKTVAFLPQS
ncbi:MAG: cofactor-independent phosphoglycerate mutase [Candidatus Hydrogenedentota bacterium]